MLSPAPIEEVNAAVLEQTGVSLAHAKARVGFGRGHLIELVIYLQEVWGREDERAGLAAELAVELLIGEQLFEDWIGSVSCQALPRRGSLPVVETPGADPSWVPLGGLLALVRRAVDGVRAGLPETPLWQLSFEGDWVMLEAEPTGLRSESAQPDLLMAATVQPELLKCALEGAPFSSCRFSKLGERFVYLAYQAGVEPLTERVRRRQRFEDAVDRALREAELGCVIGNGVGTHHCYVNLALSDSERSIPALRQQARGAGLPVPSWVRYFDSKRRTEWLGVWEETPPPPVTL